MKGKIYYGIIVLLSAALLIMSNAQISFFFFMAVVCLAPIVILVNFYVAKHINTIIYVDRDLTVSFVIENSGIIPAFRVAIDGVVRNMYTNSEQTLVESMAIGPKRKKETKITLESLYCGSIEGYIRHAYCYDFLGITKRKVDMHHRGGAYIYPVEAGINLEEIEKNASDMTKEPVHYLHRKGNDITEILDIREYQRSDSQKNIHWKMSAKIGKKMVRELDLPANQDKIMFMCLDANRQDNPDARNKLASNVFGLSAELMLRQMNHDAVLFDEKGSVLGKYSIEGNETQEWFENAMLDGNLSFDEQYIEEYIINHHIKKKYSTVFLVNEEEIKVI